MKSELLYHNNVIGICCCIGGDPSPTYQRSF